MIARILQARDRGLTIIFARTKRSVAKVADELTERGFAVGAIHGDLGQGAREQALRAFRKGKVDVLVATDVAARGIDVDDVTHVINYQCTEDEKTYLHRIGRTARAGNTGTAVTFVDWDDMPRWSLIDKALDLGIPEPQETYSSSPHLFEDLDIPEGTKGTLPRAARTRAGLEAEVVEDLGETGRSQRGPRGGHGPRHGQGERDGDSAGRSPRSRRRSTGAGTPAAGEGAAATADGDAPARTPRRRRRTRGGVAVEAVPAGAAAGAAATVPAGAAFAAQDSASDRVTVVVSGPGAGHDDSGADAPAPRRRRRRGGRGGGSAEGTAPVGDA